jgi:hypothetical protein
VAPLFFPIERSHTFGCVSVLWADGFALESLVVVAVFVILLTYVLTRVRHDLGVLEIVSHGSSAKFFEHLLYSGASLILRLAPFNDSTCPRSLGLPGIRIVCRGCQKVEVVFEGR